MHHQEQQHKKLVLLPGSGNGEPTTLAVINWHDCFGKEEIFSECHIDYIEIINCGNENQFALLPEQLNEINLAVDTLIKNYKPIVA